MISPLQADQLIEENVQRWPTESVPLNEAHHRVLRQTVVADRDQPPFDRVTMDGIAVSADAVRSGQRRFAIQGVQGAGQTPMTLTDQHHCIEIMTGAVLPLGCDAVVPVERLTIGAGEAELDDQASADRWQFVHRRGSDFPQGKTLIEPGIRLRSPELAVLASVGLPQVEVARWPVVSVISTGDELVEPGDAVLGHQVRSCNDFAIAAALSQFGIRQILRNRLPDDRRALRDGLEQAIEESSLLLLSGGVSMGKFDFLPEVFDQLGVRRVFHRVRQRPGKPLWFGVTGTGIPVFGLPGNPVSALVCLHRYVLPAMARAAGLEVTTRPVVALEAPPPADDWCRFLPVRLSVDGCARVVPLNTSGDFFSLSGTDGLIEWPVGGRSDGMVDYLPWSGS